MNVSFMENITFPAHKRQLVTFTNDDSLL